MSIKDLSIRRKLIGGFSLLTLTFVINAAVSFYSTNRNAAIIRKNTEVTRPSELALRDLRNIITTSKGYITNWVYQQSNQEDKNALRKLQSEEYPKVKANVNRLKKYWTLAHRQRVDSIITQYEAIEKVEKQIMADLATFEDYDKDGGLAKMNATMVLETEILAAAQQTLKKLNSVIVGTGKATLESDAQLLDSFASNRRMQLISTVIVLLLAVVCTIALSRDIVLPINHVRNIVQKLSLGELPEQQNRKFNKDEMGEMAAAVEILANGLRGTSLFAESIGRGNYAVEYQPLGEKDVLGNALIEMRDNLKRVADDDKRRNWATEGMAIFGETLRKSTASIEELSDEILAGLVKYTKANQGGLYIVDNENQQAEPFLELKACYAWDKKKFVDQKIHIGEGLAGQVWQEGEHVYITEVPRDYITITSGLGEANPRSVLITPLKVNEQVYGVLELASFGEFAEHEIEFVAKIGESIASTLSSAQVNIRTQKMYRESTMLTEQMRAQEEEMRQNMEELMATQEELQRKQNEMETANAYLRSREEEMQKSLETAQQREKDAVGNRTVLQRIIDTLPRAVFWKDTKLNYLGCNQMFAKVAGKDSPAELIGKSDYDMQWSRANSDMFRADDLEVLKTMKAKVDVEESQTHPGGEVIWLNTTKVPLLTDADELIGVLGMFEDITQRKKEMTRLRESTELLQTQEDVMRQNMQEMTAIRDELQRQQLQAAERERILQAELEAAKPESKRRLR